MVLFISLAILLVLAGLYFILPPLLGRYKVSETQQNDINMGIYQQRLQELEADPDLSEEQKQQARAELEKSLLQDVDMADDQQAAPAEKQTSPTLAVIIALGVPIMAIGFYMLLHPAELPELVAGDYQRPTPTASNQNPHSADLPDVNKMVAQLEAKLENEPDNAEGWHMLARSYMFMKRYQDAARAFDRALILNGESPQLLTDYAEAVAMIRGGNMMNEPTELVLRALELDANHPKALWLAGAAKLQAEDYQGAIVYWQRLMQLHTPGSEGAVELQKRIDMAKAGLEQSGGKLPETAQQTQAATQTQKPAVKTTLRVTVDIDPALKARAKPDDTLFIYARAANGSPMPLAIVRKQVRDLPITVTLDDSMAMMPQARISNFDKVYVGARVSKAGTARSQPGDLQGKSPTLTTGSSQSLAITIDEIVK